MAETRAKSLEELLAESKAQTEAILSLLNKLTQSQSSTGSERRRSESALIIQKVLRGFLVRKSVKKIIAMRREVNEIEKRLLKKEVVELIQSNTEEKLKVKETLENLLFDSVRGFDSRVRDCWTIFLKVTGLQKKFDAIVSGEETVDICNFAPTEENDNSAGIIISKNVENDSAEFVDLKQQLEYLEERRLKDLGKEHSEFISYPISRGMEKTTEKEISDDENKEYAAFYKGGEEMTSLKDYVTRMKDDQNDIYYTTDGGKKAVETSPFLEKLKKKGYEVLYMDDPFGNYVVQKLVEVCGEEQRTQTLLLMTRRELELVRICLDMHGTRSLQKLLEHLTTREQIRERKMDSGNPTILTVSSSEILIRKILNYKSIRKKLHYKPQVAVKSFPAELIMQVAATKEGTYIVGRGLAGDIFLWEGSFGRLLKKWHAYYIVVTCLVFSDDDSLLGSGLEDEWSRVWSLLSIELTALNPGEHVFLAGSRDGKIYVSALKAKSDINSKHELHNTELNGVVSEKKLSSSSSSLSPPLFFSNHADIGIDCWRRAEDATRGIIDQVQPTVFSDHRRKAAIDYVQRLIRNCVGCEVFAFGSVPLKTYLPDGDIDLTTFGGINVEDALANNVFSVLDSEDKNGAAEFVVKDVKLIHAEVKLVKCLIQNVVVDISFNQLGGLCTLYFLVQVDRLVGKDHLFKRSTVLIKAWCYYESRILGAYHGLISTYALETLVLYIFHFFHSTLNGPLEVLFRFLDYFSKFDWDNFCISLNGPVRISLLPEIFAEIPENSGDELLLSNDFLANCVEMFSVPAKGCEPNMRAFPLKHLNIFDPLKENNNLGRSVSKGNFSRIRSALAYGASKLGSFLSQSEENVEDEVRMFFCNTLDRHGSGQRPDVQNCDPSSRWSGLGSPVLFSDVELQEDLTSNETKFAYSGVTMGEHRQGHGCDTDVKTTEDENSFGTAIKNEILGTSVPVVSSTIFSEVNGLTNGTVISQDRLSPDANELVISRLEDPAFSESALQSFPSSVEATSLPFGTGIHAPHGFSKGDEELKTGISDKKHSERSTEKLELTGYMMKPSVDVSFIANGKQNGNHLVSHQDVRAAAGSKSNSSHVSSTSSDEILEALNTLSDLNGDYDSHLSSLHYGRWCYDYARTAPVPSMCPSLLSHSRSASQKRWNITQHTLQVKGNAFTQMNGNGILSRPAFFPIGPHILPGGTPFGLEEVQKHRGTGTYFPNVNHYREKTSSSMARNQVPVRSSRKNARVSTPPEINLLEKSHNDLSQSQNHVGVKDGCSDHTSGSPGRKLHHQSNGLIHRDESIVDSGSSGCQQENSRRPNSVSLLSRNLSGSLPLLEVQNSKPVLNVDQDRIAVKSYELKDDGDFPPLSI